MSEPMEIFDDVAFYWFAVVMIGIILLPVTLYKIKHCCRLKRRQINKLHPTIDSIPDYIPQNKLISNDRLTMNQLLSLQNIFFVFSWILFLLLLIQLPRWHNSKIKVFDPWEIIGVAKGSDAKTIKAAYREMVKKCHPDKCTNPPLSWTKRKCTECFILVQKAYELLTDEEAMEKIENGADPNHSGIVMMIGLPTWLLEHPKTVLLVYFTALILLVCIVTFWWKYSAQFHKSGVKKRSVEIFWRFIKPNMRLRHLLEILAASDEYRMLDVFIHNDVTDIKYKDFITLEQQITDMRINRHMSMDTIFNISYTRKCCTLLTAHLLGIQIPNSLYNEYLFILQKAPHLIDVMIDMTLLRERYWAQTLQLIHLKQAIFQGVWPNESILKQLPHWTPDIDKGIKNHGYNHILDLNYLKPDEIKTVLHKIYKRYSDNSYLINDNDDTLEYKSGKQMIGDKNINEMVSDAICCIQMYPFVKLKYCARTYAEKTIHKNDIVTVSVHLERIKDVSLLNENKFKDVSEMKPPEFDTNNKDEQKETENDYAKFDADHEDIAEKRRLQINRIEGPIVHVNRFPFAVNEKWLVILIDEQNQTVIDYKAIPDLRGLQKIDLHFQACKQNTGRYPYVLMAICDSYLGAEKIAKFKINISNKPRENEFVDGTQENDNLIGNEEREVEVKWYYLWNANFWEFLLTLFLLYFIYLIVIQCSFGKKYLEPMVNVIFKYLDPIWNLIIKYIDEFIINPITNQLLKETGFNIMKWWFGVADDQMTDDEKEYFEHAQREYDGMNEEP